MPNNKWEVEFNEKFTFGLYSSCDGREGYDSDVSDDIKSFITSLRLSDRDELIKMLSIYTDVGNCGSELFVKPIIKQEIGDKLKQLITNYYNK